MRFECIRKFDLEGSLQKARFERLEHRASQTASYAAPDRRMMRNCRALFVNTDRFDCEKLCRCVCSMATSSGHSLS